ncbi:MAG: DMT family transporter [Spirochaetales bacterium]|nr:DMT family transporter [Spirochaetales bacterium]
MVIIYALMSAFAFGTADFLGGFSSRKNSTTAAVAWSQGAGLITVLIAAPLLGSFRVTGADIFWGMAAGISGAAGVMVLFHGLSKGIASVISPLAALSGAVLPVLFGFLAGERPPLLTWTGVALSLPAILLLSWEKRGRKNDHVLRSVRLGLISGAFFGGFFIMISRTSDGSGIWPLAAARFATVPLFILLTIFRKSRIILEKGTRRVTVLSGFLDMAANVFYLLAARTGYLIIAVILSALYPAPTVLLQKIVLHEKLTVLRIAGLVLSIAGAALIGAGG